MLGHKLLSTRALQLPCNSIRAPSLFDHHIFLKHRIRPHPLVNQSVQAFHGRLALMVSVSLALVIGAPFGGRKEWRMDPRKALVTSASLVVTSALLVVTRSY